MSQIAQTIAQQIGNRAFAMMGAKQATASAAALTFKVGTNAKKVTTIRVELMGDDTYTVQFWNIRGTAMKLLAQVKEVQVDTLHSTIESNTGLYLSL